MLADQQAASLVAMQGIDNPLSHRSDLLNSNSTCVLLLQPEMQETAKLKCCSQGNYMIYLGKLPIVMIGLRPAAKIEDFALSFMIGDRSDRFAD